MSLHTDYFIVMCCAGVVLGRISVERHPLRLCYLSAVMVIAIVTAMMMLTK